MTDRERILAEAKSWLGTPYHHAADVKGVGVDCAMILVRVFVDTGHAPPFDPRPYPPDWMLHRSEERFLGWVGCFADKTEAPHAGDVALFTFGRCVSHGGIVCEPGYMIHADLRARFVVRSEIATYQHRLHSFWRVRGV